MLGKLDQKDFKQVIAKGMKTYGKWVSLVLYRIVTEKQRPWGTELKLYLMMGRGSGEKQQTTNYNS